MNGASAQISSKSESSKKSANAASSATVATFVLTALMELGSDSFPPATAKTRNLYVVSGVRPVIVAVVVVVSSAFVQSEAVDDLYSRR